MLFIHFFKKEKSIKIEFCSKNLDDETVDIFSDLLNHRHVEINEFKCLSHCELCVNSHYALINKKKIKGNSPIELFENVKKEIEKG